MMGEIITVRYSEDLVHKGAKIMAWQEATHVDEESQVYILREWKKGSLALLIPRDKYMEIVHGK